MVPAGDDQVQLFDGRRHVPDLLESPQGLPDYTTDNCEYDGEWTFDKVFETPEQLWEYAEAVLPPRRPRKKPTFALPIVKMS